MKADGLITGLADATSGMPKSNGSRYYPKAAVRIGVICDRFLYDSLEAAADFVYLSPDISDVDLASLELLLVSSTWRGLRENEWWKMYEEGSPTNRAALRIIARCRERGIPTVFLSKEDPPNYWVWLPLARTCDYVFTSAQECVAYYRKDCGHDRVFTLRFCINPLLHNPVGMRFCAKRKTVLFAGSWARKYPRRCLELGQVLDGIVKAGFTPDIINRNSFRNENRRYRFPRRFKRFLHPQLDHDELMRFHRAYDWAVNVNSVQRSETMFANRVYELQALGNLMISTPSLGMIRRFPNVFVARSSDDVGRILSAFSPQEIYAMQVAGVRRVMTGETCHDRLREIMERVGRPVPRVERRVLVVAEDVAACRAAFDAQTYSNRVLMSVNEVSETDFGLADMVAFLDAGLAYGPHYLEDMANAFKYVDCDYVVSGGEREHDYTCRMGARGRVMFWRAAFVWCRLCGMKEGDRVSNGYVVDRFSCGKAGEFDALEESIAKKMRELRPVVEKADEPSGEPEFLREDALHRWGKLAVVGPFFGGVSCILDNGWLYSASHALGKARDLLAHLVSSRRKGNA